MNIKGFLKYHIKDRIVLQHKKAQLKIWKNKTPVLVHTMAKVGSLSIYFSLLKSEHKRAFFHIHDLNEKKAKQSVDYCLEQGFYPGSRTPVSLIWAEIIRKKRPYQIITIVRDPIERNISAFFEAFELYVGVPAHEYRGTLVNLEQLYHQKLPHHFVSSWMDENLQPFTGIDVYQTPFNKKDGFMECKQGNVSILVLNSANTDKQKEKLISEFTHITDFKIFNRNITSQTKAGRLYHEFKNTIKFEEEYLHSLYDSKYAKHFFSDSHRQKALLKWKK